MENDDFETSKQKLKEELERDLAERAGETLQLLVAEILADPRTITAAILGIDVSALIKQVVIDKIETYSQEE